MGAGTSSMSSLLQPGQRAFLGIALLAIASSQIQSCGGGNPTLVPDVGASGGSGGVSFGGTEGMLDTGGTDGTGAASGGDTPFSGGSESFTDIATGGSSSSRASSGGTVGTGGASNEAYVVALVQSIKAQASDISQDDINSMVTNAVTQAGGLDFIHDGMTVVLKPNLLTHLSSCWGGTATLPPTVNGITTDWRVTKAVADLVRAKDPTGKILVMEGSNRNTTTAFGALGYTIANFGTSVDEFVALEGSSCSSRSQTGLVQKPGKSGEQYWINQRYFEADILISIAALKTHGSAGTTGCVKNVGIGSTPNAMYSTSTTASDCSRSMTLIDHSFAGLGNFVSDFYSVRPPDFAIMDGLQGLQNGPCSQNAADKKNMRLILAAKNAVALDTVEAAVMNCTGSKVPYLTRLEGWELGTTDLAKIKVVGNRQIADVQQSFSGAAGNVCN